jgi:hypothetical protein
LNADFRSPNWHDSLSPISAELPEFLRWSVMRLFPRKPVSVNRWSSERRLLVPYFPWVFERFGLFCSGSEES